MVSITLSKTANSRSRFCRICKSCPHSVTPAALSPARYLPSRCWPFYTPESAEQTIRHSCYQHDHAQPIQCYQTHPAATETLPHCPRASASKQHLASQTAGTQVAQYTTHEVQIMCVGQKQKQTRLGSRQHTPLLATTSAFPCTPCVAHTRPKLPNLGRQGMHLYDIIHSDTRDATLQCLLSTVGSCTALCAIYHGIQRLQYAVDTGGSAKQAPSGKRYYTIIVIPPYPSG